jgi:hypothetical protein
MGPSEKTEPFEERHFTVPELAEMWNLSREFVRQVVQGEPGVTEWVRQQPGRRRYRVLRVPQSVAERLYNRALGRAEDDAGQTVAGTWDQRVRGLRARRISTREERRRE